SHVVAARTGGFPENKAKELSQHCDSRACALRVEIIPQREIVPHAAGAPLRGGAVWTTIERGFGFMKGTEFSPRERQIVDAVLQAKSVKDIAADLDLSVNTVKDYLKVIYRKAMVHSARELMRKLMPGGRPPPPTTPWRSCCMPPKAWPPRPARAQPRRSLPRRCGAARGRSGWRTGAGCARPGICTWRSTSRRCWCAPVSSPIACGTAAGRGLKARIRARPRRGSSSAPDWAAN